MNAFRKNEFQVEMILTKWYGIYPDEFPILGANPIIEDCREDGVGLILTQEDLPSTQPNVAIERFLVPLVSNADFLRKLGVVVRLLVFNRAFTCSFTIGTLPLLVLFDAELDIVMYPTSDEDD